MAAVDWENSTMTLEEWDKEIDEFVSTENSKKDITNEMLWEGRGGNDIRGFARGIANRRVSDDMIRRFALGTGDLNPLYRDPDYAKNTKWGGIIAPPLMIHAVGYPSIQFPALPEGVGGISFMDGGIDHEFFQVIRPDDEFTATSTYLGITEMRRKDPKKRMMLSKTRCDYYNRRKEKVCSAVGIAIIICLAPGSKVSGTGLTPEEAWAYKQPRYSKEVLDTIYAQYEEELSGKLERGADPRYWEDVNEGDEIPTLLLGPLDISDMFAFVSQEVNIGYPGAFAHKYLLTKLDHAYEHYDSETGARTACDWHMERVAKECGYPQGVHYGAQSMAIISHAVTNWMGDDAFVKVMNFQCRRMTYIGDTNTTTGKIVKKYEKDGEHLVDIELASATQDGVVHTSCNATVKLPLRA